MPKVDVYLSQDSDLSLAKLAARWGVPKSRVVRDLILKSIEAVDLGNNKELEAFKRNLQADNLRQETQVLLKREMLPINQGKLLKRLQDQGLSWDRLALIKASLWKEAEIRGWDRESWEQELSRGSGIIDARELEDIDKLIKVKK